MARNDWYRNEEWNSEIDATFHEKLVRSRSMRPQYLVIQAGMIARKYPEAALSLIVEYFERFEDFNVPNAYCVRAKALTANGHVAEAVAAYKSALEWEIEHPNFISTARWDYPEFVASQRIASEYAEAIEVLSRRFKANDHAFPRHRYVWNGSMALILDDSGDKLEAKEFAQRALRAAAETQSPFRYHRTLGLVSSTSDEFGIRLMRIAEPSVIRRLIRLIRS